jgi:peptidoglycan L-alanyl-D-glutamate endopeptidase CwlK
MPNFSKRSEGRLVGLHPDLVAVFNRAIATTKLDFSVIEGVRTVARQKQLLAAGASTGYAHAIDVAPLVGGTIRWDWPLYYQLAPIIKEAAQAEGIPIEWGGDWKSFKDGPHWQLPWASYPGK